MAAWVTIIFVIVLVAILPGERGLSDFELLALLIQKLLDRSE